MERLVLIDGNSLLHRAYHALPKTLTTSEGEVVNAVYGFTRMLLKVIKDLKPAYLAVAFDMKGPTFRHLEYEKYKEKRPEMDTELAEQLPMVKNLLESFEVPIYQVQGFEGEDVVASLIAQKSKIKNQSQVQSSKPNDLETVVVTGDRDVLQLVDEKTKVYAPLKGLSNPVMYDAVEVWKQYGLKPSQIVDYKALRGDPSDNIPGVSGVGEKTAVELLQKYNTLEEIYRNLEKLPERVQRLLRENKKQAELSKKLATITTTAPVELDLERCQIKDFRSEKALAALEKLQFRSLVKELENEKGIKVLKGVKSGKEDDGQMRLV